MTMMDAPVYDESKEKRNSRLLIGAGITFALLVVLTLAGYMSGHGWLFTNLPVEHKVGKFFAALQAKDYNTAYAIYNNDPDWQQHLDKYKGYTEARFQQDWTTEDPIKGPVNSYHVDISRTDGEGTFGTGVIVAVTVNKSTKVFMYYIRKDGTLTWPAYHELQY